MSSFRISLLCAALLLACSNDDKGAGTTPSGPVGVSPPSAGSDAAVFVRARLEGETVIAEIATRATPALSGAALRVAFPSWLRFDRRDPDSGWSAESVHHTKLGTDSEVVIADTRKGKGIAHPAPAADGETVLTTLYFTRTSPPPAEPGALRLVPARSELRDAEGNVVAATYYDQPFSR